MKNSPGNRGIFHLVELLSLWRVRRRHKVLKALEGFGKRVQYSVFECLLTPAQVIDLQRKLKKLAGKDDSVRFYFIGADDVKRIALLGGANITSDRPFILH